MPLFTRRRLLSGFAALGAVAGVFGLRSTTARYYDGPVSDHFDGTRFFDVNGSAPRSLADQWRWWRNGEREKWPEWAPSSYSDTPPARIGGGGMGLSHVGPPGFFLPTAARHIPVH